MDLVKVARRNLSYKTAKRSVGISAWTLLKHIFSIEKGESERNKIYRMSFSLSYVKLFFNEVLSFAPGRRMNIPTRFPSKKRSSFSKLSLSVLCFTSFIRSGEWMLKSIWRIYMELTDSIWDQFYFVPDEHFPNLRASESLDRRILCNSGTSCDGFLSSQIMRGLVE